MRVLVAGAAGFVGSHLVDRLLADGHTVVGVDNLCTGRPENLAHLVGHPLFTFMEADVTAPLEVDGPLQRVYHLASPASPVDYLERPFETLYAGSDGTRALATLALGRKARFLLTSTSEVYGDPEVHPQPEGYWGKVNSIGPRSVYDEAKRYAEALTMAFHRYEGLETRIARIFNTYGPRMRHADGRVIPNFAVQALLGEPLTVYGDGSQTRSYCFVTDTVDGLIRLMEGSYSLPVNLGNPYELTVRELARAILQQVGRPEDLVFEALPEDDPRVRRPDITLAQRELGWAPRVGFNEGIAATLDQFRADLGL
ncbi:MAG: SDR family oxidoreductase [Deltaproteobacteria bacterium]|nr:SDR family oxidoreductase [Deltaproteobacteria bacterium]